MKLTGLPIVTIVISSALISSAWAAPHLSSNSTGQYTGHKLNVDGRDYPTKYLQHPQALNEEMTYEKLKELITNPSRRITKISSLIEALPQHMKDDNYVVMYRSRSLQHATPTKPRVLVYSPTARLILSFNGGDTNVKGHDSIEVIQFRDSSARFEFREIQFGKEDELPTFSDANPRKCFACHQGSERKNVDLRPNWEPYNIWPGAIGAKDGGILPHSPIEIDKRIKSYDKDFLEEQAREPKIIEEFITLSVEHPRYKHLGHINMNAPVALSELLAILNFKRIIRMMKVDQEHFNRNKEALTLLGECGGYMPHEITSFYGERAPKERYYSYSSSSISDGITALFEGAGIDTSDWSMDFGTQGRFALFERFGTPTTPYGLFEYAWAVTHQVKNRRSSAECEQLRKTAVEKLQADKSMLETKYPLGRQIETKKTPRQILAICMNCHNSEDDTAPAIPFENETQFAVALNRKATLSARLLRDEILYRTSDMATNGEQMPPAKRLSPTDRKTLADYIDQLSPSP